MKKTIKYLDNDGNYQYATVKDAGDLDKLKTKAKEDLVSAINELATNGIAAGNIDEINNKVDQIQQQVNQNADALNMSDQERQEMQQQIAQMQAEVQAKVAEMQKLAEEQNKKLQEASAELKKKADAIDVQKMQQDNAEALKNSAKALEDSLAATNEDLQKTADHLNEMEIQAGVVETSVKELQNGFESKVSSADFNEARTKLQEQETMVRQLNNELSTKASNNELDMVTQRVQKAESDIQQNAQGIKASVTKETMYKEMDDFAKYRENRLKYSRDFSNDWSLNGNDIIDDDHLFDTQHDVKSVSIRNGAYLTQTTDLDTDDMSKTFALAMWVEKGKKPRAWYGSAELTNMKVKEDKGDYQRVYWTFVPTIVKQDIRITGDTSTQGNLIISEPKLEQSDRPSAWSTNTGDQYATTEKLAHDLKLTADKLESTITKQSEFADRQQQDESRITQTEHGVEVANQTIVAKTDGLRQEFDGKINATSKSLTTEYQSFTNRALGQMADGGANLILNSSFGSLKNSFDKWTNVNPKARIVTDDNGLKWVKLEQSGLTADSPIGLTSNLFRVKKGIVTIGLDIRTDNGGSIDNDNIVILESYSADQKRVFTKDLGFDDFKITRETLFDHGSHRVTYKYNQTRDDTQYMAVHILLPKNGNLYATNVLARTIANGEDSGEYAPNDADLREQVVQQRTRIEQNDQAIALKADQTKVTQDIDAAKSSLSGAISKVEQRAANLEVKADGITSSVSTLSKTVDGIQVGGRNLLKDTDKMTNTNYWGARGGRVWRATYGGKRANETSVALSDYNINCNSDAPYIDYIPQVSFEQGTDYTISFWTTIVDAPILYLNATDSDNHQHYNSQQNISLQANGRTYNGWEQVTATFKPTVATAYLTFAVSTAWVSSFKLEKGNKATDWQPAPEDTDSNISALESRASKLEQTDSEIKATVTSVTNDLKNGRATLKEGIMSMTDDHFSTKFSSIDNRLNNIGGTNYITPQLIRPSYSNLSYDANSGEWTAVIGNGSGGAWGGGIGFNRSKMEVPWGQPYTDSVEVYVTNPGLTWSYDINNAGVVADSNLGGNDNDDRNLSTCTPSTATAIPTNQWVKVSFTAWNKNSKNKNHTALWDGSTIGIVNNTGQSITVKFRHPKQELGSVATDWSPSISELSEGGNNIALRLVEPTGTLESFTVDDTANKGNSGWKWGTIVIPDGLKIGDTITVSAETKFLTGSDPTGIQVVLYDEKITKAAANQQFLRPGRRDSVTLTVTQDASTMGGVQPNRVLIYSGVAARTQGKKVQIDKLQIENGSIAHGYAPATVRKTDFDVAIDGIRTNVTNLQNNTLKYSSMEQTADGFKFTVGSGSNQKTIDLNANDNLLIGTSSNWRKVYNYGAKGAWREYFSSNSLTTPIGNFATGQSFTYSLDFKNASDHHIAVETFWRDVNGARITNVKPSPNSSAFAPNSNVQVHYEMTTDGKPANAYYLEAHVISTDANTSGLGSYIYIRNEKLEANDHATPWCVSSGDKSGNLLTGSTTYDGWIAYDNNSVKDNGVNDNWKDNNGNPARKQSKAWHGYTEKIWLKNGTYTFSGQVWIGGDAPVWVYTSHPREGAFGNSAMIEQQAMQLPATKNQWQTFVFPFEVGHPGYVFPRVESSNDNTVIHIASFKVERGLHTTTQWSEHPQTTENKTTNLQKGLSTAQATIEQNSKSIALKVDTGRIINTINNSTEGISISGNKIDIKSLKSAINLDGSGVHIKGDHISINGDTGISGTLDVKDVVLSGKKGLIQLNGNEGISLVDLGGKNALLITPDKVQLRAFNDKGGSVDVTNSGVTIGMSYNQFEVADDNVRIINTYSKNQLWMNDTQLNFTLNSNNRIEVMGGLRTSYLNTNENINGIHLVISTQQELGDPYGGDEFGIGRQIEKGSALTNGTIEDDFVYNASGVGKLKGFHFYKSIYLEDTNKKPIIFYGDNGSNGIWMNAYGNIEGGANSWAWKVRDAAGNLRLQLPMAENRTSGDGAWMRFRDFTMDIEGAENKLKFTWWSNGGFYGGVKVPCLATDNVFSGKGNGGSGIAFANGQYVYFTRDKWRSVGI